MAIDKDRLKEDATNILRGIGKFTPGGILKGLIEGNEGEILKVIRTILSGTAPGRAAEAVQILVDRYKLPESVAERLVANEMTDANMPVDSSESADEGFPSRPEFESSAEDTSVPPRRKRFPSITSEMLEDLLKNRRSRTIPLPEPILEGGGRNVIPLPRPILEGGGRNVIPLPRPSDDNEIGDYMFNKGGRVEYAEGTKMASAPDIQDERNELAMKLFGKPLRLLTPEEMDLLDEEAERLMQKFMAQGGRVLKQTGGITESRILPPEFIAARQQAFLTELDRQTGLPSVTTANVKQPGETDAQFAQRQAQATQFGITRAGMAELAPKVADETALQQQARGLAGGLGSFQPFLTDATTAAGAATALTGTGAGTGAGSIASYTSPYQQQVIDTTMAEFDRQAQIRANQQAAATLGTPGAFGGGREGVQRAEYQAASDRNRAATFANLQQQGFQNAAARRQQDLANQMNISNLQSGLGARAQDFSRAQISGLGTLGAAQQAQTQAVLDAQRQAAQMAIQEPRQALARFGQGIAALSGQTGAGRVQLDPTQETAEASPLMKALGLGLAGADIYGRIF